MNAALWLLWVALFTLAAQAALGDGAHTKAQTRAEWARNALDQAIAATADIQDPFHHAQSLAGVAETRAVLGETGAAVPLLQLAAESADRVDDPSLASWARHDIAMAFLKAGEIVRAEAAAATVEDVQLRDAVLVAVSDAKRTEQDMSGALFTAWRIRDPDRQAETLRRIVIAQTSARDMQGALTTAGSIAHPIQAAVALGDVATTYARDGHIGDARKHALRIRDARVRSEVQAGIAAIQAELGDFRDAALATGSIDDRLCRAQAVARVAAAAVRFGEAATGSELFTQALALAKDTRSAPERKLFTLIDIARSQISAGRIADARETLQRASVAQASVKRSRERIGLLQQVASLQARMGDHAAAIQTAGKVDDASIRPQLVRDVAAAQAESGDVAGAVAMAMAMDDRASAAAAMLGVLRVQARSEDAQGMTDTIRAALRKVRVIGDTELKAGALASLAAAQMNAGDVGAARDIYDEAMNAASRASAGPARVAAFSRIADALGESAR